MSERIKVKIAPMPGCEDLVPKQEHPGDAGYDLRAAEDFSLYRGEVKKISTGVRFEIPEGYELQIRSRSGLAGKYGIRIFQGIGTLDSSYRGILFCLLERSDLDGFSDNNAHRIEFKRGDRIAQAVFNKVEHPDIEVVTEADLSNTSRGEGGFGSTGVASPAPQN